MAAPSSTHPEADRNLLFYMDFITRVALIAAMRASDEQGQAAGPESDVQNALSAEHQAEVSTNAFRNGA
jgi:hypothetical protein